MGQCFAVRSQLLSQLLLLLLLLPLLLLLLLQLPLLLLATPPSQLHLLHPDWAVVASRRPNCERCRRRKGSGSLSVTAAEVAKAQFP